MNKQLLGALVLGLLTVGWALATTVAGAPPPGPARRVPQAPGDLDLTFGSGGIITATYGSSSTANGLARQPDGRLLLVSSSDLSGSLDWAVARYTTTGALDPTFDGDGLVTTDFNGGSDRASAGVVQPDARILVAGSAAIAAGFTPTTTLALARYLPDGTLDPQFGTGGKVTTRVGPNSRDAGYDVALTADNKIVVVGRTTSAGQAVWLLARYLSDGTLDATFGNGGLVVTTRPASGLVRVALVADGTVLIAGTTPGTGDFALARYLADGSPDPSFGTGGYVVTDFDGNSDEANGLLLQADGKIVLAGTAITNSETRFALARYLPNGSLDAQFGSGGKLTTSFSTGGCRAYAIRQDSVGRLVAVGWVGRGAYGDFGLARYNANGSLDLTFGNSGLVQTAFGLEEGTATTLLIAPDEKLIVGGNLYNRNTGAYGVALARYEGAGTTNTATPTASLSATGTRTPTATATCGVGGLLIPSPPNGTLAAVAALSASDVWAVGAAGGQTLTVHWDGSTWTTIPSPNLGSTANYLTAVAARTTADIWAVGYTYDAFVGLGHTLTLHWNGSAWSVVPSPDGGTNTNELTGVVALNADSAWASGYAYVGSQAETLVLYWNGSTWARVPSPTVAGQSSLLFALTAAGPDDLWTVGTVVTMSYPNETLVLHWDGVTWSRMPSPNVGLQINYLNGVAVGAPDDVWAVGSASASASGGPYRTLTLHWNGSTWAVVPSPNGTDGTGILRAAAAAPGEVWAVGYTQEQRSTLALRWSGTNWTSVAGLNPGSFYNRYEGVAATGAARWVVGSASTPTGALNTLTVRYSDPCGGGGATPTSTAPPSSTPTGTPSRPPIGSPTATLPASTVTPPPATPCLLAFLDVDPANPFYPFVRCLACRGIVSGYGDGTFRPYNTITRSQLGKMVVLAGGYGDVIPSGQQTFEDAPNTNPFWVFIETLAGRGYISGYSCGSPGEPCVAPGNRPYFRPYANITRGQIAKVDANAAGYTEGIAPAQQTFEDVLVSNPFWVFVERVALHSVISGYGCGGVGEPCEPPLNRPYFRPYGSATRGQTAKIVANTFYPGCQTPGR